MTTPETPTIDERLATAGNGSNMKPTRATAEDGGTIGPLELVTAAGWTSRTLANVIGRALMALESEWDGIGAPRKPRQHDIDALTSTMPMEQKDEETGLTALTTEKQRRAMASDAAYAWYEQERLRTVQRLRTLPAAQFALAQWIAREGIDQPEGRALSMLAWWLDHLCPKCTGTKLDPLPTGGRGATRACKACSGRGERGLPGDHHSRRIEQQMNESRQNALQALRRFTAGHHRK